jgi:hypothetical protein
LKRAVTATVSLSQLLKRLVNLGFNALSKMLINPLSMLLTE